MVKSWNERLNTPGINGVKPTPRTIGDVVEGQPMLVPTARQVDGFIRSYPTASRWTSAPCAPLSPSSTGRK